MFDSKILDSLETVGTFVLFQDTIALMIGPDKSGEKLGIMRFGGHIEEGESLYEALEREVMEEASIRVELINSPKTYYKKKWATKDYIEIDDVALPVKPLIIAGDIERSTTVFLSYTEEIPVPSSEAYGIIFLKEQNIRDICTKKMLLKDFLSQGGKLVQQKYLSYDMEIYAGMHLKFLHELIQNNEDLICKYLKGELI